MNIKIRKGRLKDIPFVRKLAVKSVIYGIPGTRRISPAMVQKFTWHSLADLEFTIYSPDFALIIAEDLDIGKPIGYLMLDLNQVEKSTGEPQSLIHDLAVEKEYWGKFVVDRLMSRAEEITSEKGLIYIVGEISASNRRPLIYATRRLKYKIERHQIIKVLD
ncbi:MAG: GNAT family N-acetyltransferase [Candidatus Eremiobacteraeota bacterium]|nr:GNAT family N-acetyltransferase [Candidatus Eremiobacteraeota bacterium]